MANLKAGTLISGNMIWHAGNMPFTYANGTLRVNDKKIYSELDKPTPAELGVLPIIGGSINGNLQVQGILRANEATANTGGITGPAGKTMMRGTSSNAIVLGNDTAAGMYFDTDSAIYQVRYRGQQRNIYHEGYKPSSADVNALPITGGTLTGDLSIGTAGSIQRIYLGSSANTYIARSSDSMFVAANATNGRVVIEGKLNPLARVNGQDYDIYHKGLKPTPEEIGADKKYSWTAQVKKGTWSAIAQLNVKTLAAKALITIGHTRGNVVVNAMVLMTCGHSTQAGLTQLESHGYSQIKVRVAMVDPNNARIEILDENATGALGDIYAYQCEATNVYGILDQLTAFTESTGAVKGTLTTEYRAIKIGDNKVYHQGFKPTAADLNVLSLSGGTMSNGSTINTTSGGDLSVMGKTHGFIGGRTAGYVTGNAYFDGAWRKFDNSKKSCHLEAWDGNLTFFNSGAGSDNPTQNRATVYHSNNKPTAADVGALPLTGGTMTGPIVAGAINSQFRGRSVGVTDANSLHSETQGDWGYSIIGTGAPNIFPVSNNANGLLTFNAHSGKYGRQIGFSSNGSMYTRYNDGTSWVAWRKMYDEGNKPTPAEIGAVNKAGDTMTGALVVDVNSPTPLTLRRTTQVGMKFIVGGATRVFGVDNNSILRFGANDDHGQNYKVYHSGDKPSAADLGVVPASDVSWANNWADIVNKIPKITSNGVLEIGKYIDFHDTNSTADYNVRLNTGVNHLALQTQFGSIDIGAQNSTYAHINTDRAEFSMNKTINTPVVKLATYSGSYLDMRTSAGCIQSNAAVATNAASVIARQEHADRHFVIGGLGNGNFGFYMINKNRTVNGTDAEACLHSNGRFATSGGLEINGGYAAINATNNHPILELHIPGKTAAMVWLEYSTADICVSTSNGAGGETLRRARFAANGDFFTHGNVNANDVYIRSDIRLKTDLIKVDNALSKVEKLQAYSYDKHSSLTDSTIVGREVGLIAQDLREVLPEAVNEAEDTTLTISNAAVNALLVEAIKELKAEIEELKRKLAK